MKQLTKIDVLITDLDGTAVVSQGDSPLTLKRALATILSRGQSNNPVRNMNLARALWGAAGDTLDVEDSSIQAMIESVRNDRGYTDLVKAALLSMLEAAGDVTEPRPEQ